MAFLFGGSEFCFPPPASLRELDGKMRVTHSSNGAPAGHANMRDKESQQGRFSATSEGEEKTGVGLHTCTYSSHSVPLQIGMIFRELLARATILALSTSFPIPSWYRATLASPPFHAYAMSMFSWLHLRASSFLKAICSLPSRDFLRYREGEPIVDHASMEAMLRVQATGQVLGTLY
jgi:hypothetical protein